MFALNQVFQGGPSELGNVSLVNAEQLTGGMHYDTGLRRPYVDDRGRVWVDVTVGRKPKIGTDGQPVTNAGSLIYERVTEPQLVRDRFMRGEPVINVDNASVLRKDQWLMLDNVVLTAARARLRAWADLRAASTFGGFDGMATPILEHEIMTDPGEAIADMDALSEGRNFQPAFALQGLPLPISHSDFFLGERFLAASHSKGQPQDTIRAEVAGRRVSELVERTLIGSVTGVEYGASTEYLATSKVYGYTNHPDRITKTNLTASASFDGEAFYNEVLAMRELAYAQNFFGPFMLYTSVNYDAKLDQIFKTTTGNFPSGNTVRTQVGQIDGITGIRRLDYLTGDVLLLVQMTGDVVQAVNGLELVTVQWDTKGGMQHNFKVMCIQVPRIRSVYKSGTTTTITGIVHGTTS